MEENNELIEILEVLFRQKKFIILSVVFTVIITLLFSLIFFPKKFEAHASFLLSEPKFEGNTVLQTIPGAEELFNPINYITIPSVATYSEILKDPGFLTLIYQKLNLDKRIPKLTLDDLTKMISIENPKDSSILKVSILSEDPELSYIIAKAISDEFLSYSGELNKVIIDNQLSYLENQIELAIKDLSQKEKSYKELAVNLANEELSESLSNLIIATKRYNDFLAQKDNIDILTKEIEVKFSLFSKYQQDLASYKLQLVSYQSQLEEAKNQIASTDQFLTLIKSIDDSPFLAQLAADPSNPNFKDLVNLQMKSTIVNPLYENLQSDISSLKIQIEQTLKEQSKLENMYSENISSLVALQQELAKKNTELATLQNALSEAQKDYNLAISHFYSLDNLLSLDAGGLFNKDSNLLKKQLQLIEASRELSLARDKYNLLRNAYSNSKIIQSMNFAFVKIATQPVLPEKPVSPRPLFNCAIAGIASLFLSIIIAFLVDYLQRKKSHGGL